ncbi:MAG: LysR family transcriptional regulator [Solirubrobacterales bacterium]|nr:LysR family transcriptional regulator [Solirubrobacterales bacterium]
MLRRRRIVHRWVRAGDQREVRETPLEAPIPPASGTELHDAPASPPRLTAVNGSGMADRMQVENVHPIRLRLLLEIDRTGSISAAAERCGIGQPSASTHLRTLETAIGQRLVIRNGRGSSLTAAGKIVAWHAAKILATLNSMRWALDARSAPSSGELLLAASHTPSLILVPPMLCAFSERFPGVSLKVRTLPSEMVVREVARGAADMGIAGEVACTEPVLRHQLLIDELVGIAPAGLLGSGRSVSRGEFARHSLLLGPEGSSTRMVTERHLARAEYRPGRIWAFDSGEAIKRAVAAGLGVSFMSRSLVDEAIQQGEMVRFGISGGERMMRPIYALQPNLAELTPHAAGFMTMLMNAHRNGTPSKQLAEG